jgi:hypothetical protein
MAVSVDIGRRIELLAMDSAFEDITVGLYLDESTGVPAFRVHTYSARPGAAERIAFLRDAMQKLGAMLPLSNGSPLLRHECGDSHTLATRRLFLEAGKLATDSIVQPRPASIFDKKSAQDITVERTGSGYEVHAHGSDPGRASSVAAGLAKLGALLRNAEFLERVEFPCGHSHDALIGLLLPRALNVRAVLREEEMSASRGVLAAPSAQK